MFEYLNTEIAPIWKLISASLSGSLIGRLFRPEVKPLALLCTTVAGVVMALIIVPFLVDVLGDVKYGYVISLFIGMFGVPICERLDKAIKKIDWEGIAESRLKGGK